MGETPNNYDTIVIEGSQREYRLFVPSTYKKELSTPLIINFHGTSTNPDIQEALSQFEVLGEVENVIVATPMAAYEIAPGGPLTWNTDKREGVDDVKFIERLVVHLQNQFNIDSHRIYATGFSGGARMSSRLACDLAEVIAAIGPVAGIRHPSDCKPSRSVPVITFHGKQDPVNHYMLQPDSPVYWRMGIEDAVSAWTKHNQCSSSATELLSPSLARVNHKDCQNNAEVVFYRSEDSGHTWPGSPMAKRMAEYGMGKTEEDLAATSLIWQFFNAHPKP